MDRSQMVRLIAQDILQYLAYQPKGCSEKELMEKCAASGYEDPGIFNQALASLTSQIETSQISWVKLKAESDNR